MGKRESIVGPRRDATVGWEIRHVRALAILQSYSVLTGSSGILQRMTSKSRPSSVSGLPLAIRFTACIIL